jgi:rhamnosyltransferase subunit B
VSRRIVLATWGSWGDLFPYLGLALRLKALGHEPILASCPFHRPAVERAGIAFAPLRPDVNPADTALARRIMDPARGTEVVIRELIVSSLREQHADLSAVVPDADLVVSHPVTFAAPIAADEARVPWISSVLAPVSFFSRSDFPALPAMPSLVHLHRMMPWTARVMMRLARAATRAWTQPVHDFRRERGLPPGGDPLYEGQFSPRGTLALFSPVLAEPQRDWPVNTRVSGFVWHNGPAGMLSPELEEFLVQGDAPIVFTLGSSAVTTAGRFYRESALAARSIGARAVLLVGRDPANWPSAPSPDTFVADVAPHEQLFPRASAVVHHGGIGTTGQALRSGHPMLVVPFAHDQPDNAHRVSRLGVARVLYPKQYRASRVAAELRALLTTTTYATRADLVGRSVRADRGVDAACEFIVEAARR